MDMILRNAYTVKKHYTPNGNPRYVISGENAEGRMVDVAGVESYELSLHSSYRALLLFDVRMGKKGLKARGCKILDK